MRILQVNATCGIGSTGKICLELSEMLNSKGIENIICYSTYSSDYTNCYKFCSRPLQMMNAFNSRLFGNLGFEDRIATKKLIELIDSFRPEIIHLHNIHSHDVNLEMLFSHINNMHIPVVLTMHDCWEFTGYCPHYMTIGCEKWKSECYACPLYHRYSWFFDRSTDNYNRKKAASAAVDNLYLVTPSGWLKGEVEQSFLQDRPCVVIPNGIDTDVFRPVKSDLKQQLGTAGKKMVLNVAMPVSQAKGKDNLIALSRVLPSDYCLVLVGVPDEHRNDFPDNVIVRPRTASKEELAAYYAAADVFVNPTHADTYSMVNLEALSCGTPVVTFEAGGAGEMLNDTVGRKVPIGDDTALAAAVMEMTEKKNALSSLCRTHVLEHYTQQIFCDSYLRLYEEILAKNGQL